MKKSMDFESARALLLDRALPMDTERVPLDRCHERILAFDLRAQEDVPAFDRSPYDGYAVRADDLQQASTEHPVTLRITEEIPAGSTATIDLQPGFAAKVLTGAPIPPGTDAVVMFERTQFTKETVTLFAPVRVGENVIRAGEDVRRGTILARVGTVIDPGLMGTLAAQGVAEPTVYRRPRAAVISTGSEIVDLGEEIPAGKIRNSNRYTLAAALERDGCDVVYVANARDDVATIAARLTEAMAVCDLIVTTGGVSVGDYDLTPAAMEQAGVDIWARGVGVKPGMACAYGRRGNVTVYALSGNPASSYTNYCGVVRPAVLKMGGRGDQPVREAEFILENDFKKSSKGLRLLRGQMVFKEGRAYLRVPDEQGNVVISSAVGCDAMAIVPAGSGPLSAGTLLKGFLL